MTHNTLENRIFFMRRRGDNPGTPGRQVVTCSNNGTACAMEMA